MQYDPLNRAGRRTRRRQRLGPDARCLSCGRAEPEVLIRAGRSLFELHHPLGQAHEPDLTVPVCLNCHAIFSAAQYDDAIPLDPQPTVLERIIAIFQALVSFLGGLAKILVEWVVRALRFVAGLDADYPEWRTKSWAL